VNIGIIVDNDFNNDIRVRKEARVLLENGYKIFVLCFGYKGIEVKKIENIVIERISISKRRKDILFALFNNFPFYEKMWKNQIKKFIAKYKINVLHVHDLYMSKAAFNGIKLSKKNIPLILDLHENFPAAINSYNWTKGFIRNLLIDPNAWRNKEKEYLKYATKLIVLSDHFKIDLIQKYSYLNEDNIIVYPNVIDFKRFDEFTIDNSLKKKNKITLLYFGLVAERRGIFDTIRAFESVIKKGYDVSLLIIGPIDKADRNRFNEEINNINVREYIEYIPWIDISKLITYLNISDICLAPFHKNPQHESGIANKLFQYMYGAKPIIASDCAPQKELIETYKCGLVFSNLDKFIQNIISLIENNELRLVMGQNAKDALHKKFNPNTVDNVLINLYSNI